MHISVILCETLEGLGPVQRVREQQVQGRKEKEFSNFFFFLHRLKKHF